MPCNQAPEGHSLRPFYDHPHYPVEFAGVANSLHELRHQSASKRTQYKADFSACLAARWDRFRSMPAHGPDPLGGWRVTPLGSSRDCRKRTPLRIPQNQPGGLRLRPASPLQPFPDGTIDIDHQNPRPGVGGTGSPVHGLGPGNRREPGFPSVPTISRTRTGNTPGRQEPRPRGDGPESPRYAGIHK